MKKVDNIITIRSIDDISNINNNTKYINLDISNISHDVIKYFINNGKSYLYSETIDNNSGFVYVDYNDFYKAESIIELIYSKMPNDLNKLEIARYLYISLAKNVYYDINIDINKNIDYDISLISKINNIWGSLSINKINELSISKLYYYLCKRMDIDISIIKDKSNNIENKIHINNQILNTCIYKDIPYIISNMKTKYFHTYNDDIDLDKKIKYIKNKYNDYYIDNSLKNIDYTKEDCLESILSKTNKIFDIEYIKPMELSIIYKYIFDKYCPNYNIIINNLYLNNKDKNHFILITYNEDHYSYNYKKKSFVKVTESDLIDNLKTGNICLYNKEILPNIDSKMYLSN